MKHLPLLFLIASAIGNTYATCSDGKYLFGGSTICVNCKNGNKCVGGVIIPCAIGTFQDTVGQSVCEDCIPGSYTNTAEALTCVNCMPGTYNNNLASTGCIQCSPGKWNDFTGASVCELCSVGTWSDISGKADEFCTPCRLGFMTRSSASKGSSSEGESCEQCTAGKYSFTEFSTECTDCPQSTYSTEAGSTSCTDCTMGKSHTQTAQTIESVCVCGSGTEVDEDNGGCKPCTSRCTYGQYMHVTPDVNSDSVCPQVSEISCIECETCARLEYFKIEHTCTGKIGIGDKDKQSSNCVKCKTCDSIDEILLNKCPGNTTLDLGECIRINTLEISIGTSCPVNQYLSPSVRVVFDSFVPTSFAPLISHDEKYGTEISSDASSYTIFDDYWQHNAGTPSTVYLPSPPLKFVHGVWSFQGYIFFGIADDGSITKSTLVNDIWITDRAWCPPTANPSSLSTSVVQCVSLPYRDDGTVQIMLICSYDKVPGESEEKASAYIVTIDNNGIRSPPRHEQLGLIPGFPRRTNAGIFYDHSRNVLYWNLHTGNDGLPPYIVLEIKLSVVYNVTEFIETRFNPGGVYGLKIGGAQIDPTTGSLYFYSNGPYAVTINNIVYVSPGHVLYKFDRYMQEPERFSSVSTGLQSVSEPSLTPTLFISKTGRFYMYNPASLKWTTTLKCELCPGGRIALQGSTGVDDCICGPWQYLNDLNQCTDKKNICAQGQYKSDEGDATHDISCTVCTECETGKYWNTGHRSPGCLYDQDTNMDSCVYCRSCDFGSYISNHAYCDGSTQSHCSLCNQCDDLQYIEDECTGTGTEDTQKCAFCAAYCTPGEYITAVGGCDGTGYDSQVRVCADCIACEAGKVVSEPYCTGSTRSANQACVDCDICASGEYISGGCDLLKPSPTCTVCPSCPSGTYRGSICTGINRAPDQECIPCKTCAMDYISSGCVAGSMSDTSICTPCSICSLGNYISTRCDGSSFETRTCSQCLDCGPGNYISQYCSGSTYEADTNVCLPCQPCPQGQYISAGCDGTGAFTKFKLYNIIILQVHYLTDVF
jgi:hypothetical protein